MNYSNISTDLSEDFIPISYSQGFEDEDDHKYADKYEDDDG
jgi:hypothetical protein